PSAHVYLLTLRPPPSSTLFPTRRSSDLERQHAPHAIHRAVRIHEQPGRVREPEQLGQMRHGAPALRAPDHAEMRLVAVQIGEEQDRKSTRLNSSHVEISYAVFCLKKKKT